ncbi:hypothetical protein NQ315_013829 [Exocentrus adspersus]|uniref:Uncharacterized protein n=1 Tax=Exocentrus adspersus TaxID=1586481 RepID=A0AAV8VHA9_9CUCU|nr:hypothetical protein NQ315_013829 [Exocentrus adspersus]
MAIDETLLSKGFDSTFTVIVRQSRGVELGQPIGIIAQNFLPPCISGCLENEKVIRDIANLQNHLRSIIFSENSDNNIIQAEPTSLSLVSSLEHEVSYWESTGVASKKDRITKVASMTFRDILEPIARDFSIIDGLPTTEVEDLLEKSHNVLDDLWRHEPPYPKERLKHIMNIIASDVGKFVIMGLKKVDIWNSDYNEIADLLLQHISLGEKWLNTCKQLTEIFWPNYGTNPWKESVYQPQDLIHFVELLKKILSIRTLHKQLVRLLTPQERDELKTKEMFQPFIDSPLKTVNLLWLSSSKFILMKPIILSAG